jgi:hypothetical protein
VFVSFAKGKPDEIEKKRTKTTKVTIAERHK